MACSSMFIFCVFFHVFRVVLVSVSMWVLVTTMQAITQLYECRKQLDHTMTEKSSLEADVARLSEECAEAAAKLHTVEVS